MGGWGWLGKSEMPARLPVHIYIGQETTFCHRNFAKISKRKFQIQTKETFIKVIFSAHLEKNEIELCES